MTISLRKPFPLADETIDYVVAKADETDGIGANFIITWSTYNIQNNPIFHAVMILANGQQGVAFTKHGVTISEWN